MVGFVTPDITISGLGLPRLAQGTWTLGDRQCERLVRQGLDHGIRFFDTAEFYENERAVGRAIRQSGIGRENIRVATKIWDTQTSAARMIRNAEGCLQRLGLDYIDILYPHWYKTETSALELAAAFQQLVDDGKIRAVGVSNFTPSMMERIYETGLSPIVCNQVEFHPYLKQEDIRSAVAEKGWAFLGYSPLAGGEVLKDPLINKISEMYNKSPAQIVLRWAIEHEGLIPVVRMESEDEIRQNLDVFSFDLRPEDIARIDSLSSRNVRFYEHPSMTGRWGAECAP